MNLKFFTSLKYWQILMLLFILATSLRVARCFIVNRISKDGVLYVRMAENVANGDDRAHSFIENRRMPPFYILMTVAVSKAGLSMESAALLISVVAGSLLIIPFFSVVRLFFDDRIAAVSGLLIAVHPSLVRISSTIMRDSLFLFLLFSALSFAIFAIEKKSLPLWGVAGIFTAFAAATRAEGFELIPALCLWMVADIIIQKRESGQLKTGKVWRRTVAGPVIFILLFFIASYPVVKSVKGTASTWSVIDKRIIGYGRSLLFKSSEDTLKTEDTL